MLTRLSLSQDRKRSEFMIHPHAGYGEQCEVKDGRKTPIPTDMICWPCVTGTCDRKHVKTANDERLEKAMERANRRQARQRREAVRGASV